MEIILRASDLVKELHLIQGIVERKNSIPVLSNVLAEARGDRLSISATDLDVSLQGGIAAQVLKEGSITLGAKKLYEIARMLPESDVQLKVLPDAWAQIECDRVSFKVAGLPKEDFPTLPESRPGKGASLPAAVLRDLITRTAFAISVEDARYYLAGALLVVEKDALSMVATDGHRLAFARHPVSLRGGEAQRVLVPRKALLELGRLLEAEENVSFQQVDNHLVFVAGARTLASKMIEGQFPAFEKVIDIKGDKRVEIERERLALGLRRVSLLSSERSRAVRLALASGKLELSASSPELGEARESLPVDYSGAAVEIGFNAQYVLDFLSASTDAQVVLELKDGESQGLFRPRGEGDVDYRYVVMPMRL